MFHVEQFQNNREQKMKEHKTIMFLAILPLLCMQQQGCEECVDTPEDFPTPTQGFNTGMLRRPGGYAGFALLKCDASFTDINDPLEWDAKLLAGDLVIRIPCGGILGSKTSEPTVESEGSCEVDEVTKRDHSYTFIDHQDNSDFDMHAFYTHIQAYARDWKLAPIKCDLCEIVTFQSGNADANKNVDDLNSGKENWTLSFTFDELIEPAPIKLPFKIVKSVLTNLT